jgi:hypothetical protein
MFFIVMMKIQQLFYDRPLAWRQPTPSLSSLWNYSYFFYGYRKRQLNFKYLRTDYMIAMSLLSSGTFAVLPHDKIRDALANFKYT